MISRIKQQIKIRPSTAQEKFAPAASNNGGEVLFHSDKPKPQLEFNPGIHYCNSPLLPVSGSEGNV